MQKQEYFITNEQLKEDIHNVYNKLGHIPIQKEYNAHGKHSTSTFQRFGKWEDAIVALFDESIREKDATYNSKELRSKVENNPLKEDILSDILNVYNKIGRIFTKEEYEQYGNYTNYIVKYKCGGLTSSFIELKLALSKKEVNEQIKGKFKGQYQITNDELKEDIYNVYKKLNRIPLKNEYNVYGKYDANTFERFGKWEDVIIVFFDKEIREKDPNYNSKMLRSKLENNPLKEDILADLLSVYNKLGRLPSNEEYDINGKYTLSALRAKCTNLTQAFVDLKIVDSKEDVIKLINKRNSYVRITDEQLKLDLHRVYDKLNHIPTRNEYNVHGIHGSATFERFKSWENAIVTLFDEEIREKDPIYNAKSLRSRAANNPSKEDILADILRVYKQLGRLPSREDYETHGNYTRSIVYDKCQNMTQAFIDLGIAQCEKEVKEQIHIRDTPNTNIMFDNYVALCKKLGKAASITEMKTNLPDSVSAYRKAFGTIENLQIKAGYSSNRNQKVSDEDLIKALNDLYQKLQKTPTRDEIDTMCAYSSNTYKRAFGTLNNAFDKIGATYNVKNPMALQDVNVLDEIFRIYKKIGKSPSVDDFNTHSTLNYNFVRQYIKKSWHVLLLEAGIPREELQGKMKRDITDDQLHTEILRLKQKYGRYPNYYDIQRDSIYGNRTYERYGSYIKTMHTLGFTDYVSQSVYKNQMHITGEDGMIYRSNFEATGANYLLNLSLDGKIKSYSYEEKVCDERTWTCDFVVITNDDEKVWLEFDGMEGNRKGGSYYDENNEKINYYQTHGYKYIIVPYRKNIKKYINLALNIYTR